MFFFSWLLINEWMLIPINGTQMFALLFSWVKMLVGLSPLTHAPEKPACAHSQLSEQGSLSLLLSLSLTLTLRIMHTQPEK